MRLPSLPACVAQDGGPSYLLHAHLPRRCTTTASHAADDFLSPVQCAADTTAARHYRPRQAVQVSQQASL
jgi:hypothetical protein